MTLPLRRKHRITAPTTRPERTSRCVLCWALALPLITSTLYGEGGARALRWRKPSVSRPAASSSRSVSELPSARVSAAQSPAGNAKQDHLGAFVRTGDTQGINLVRTYTISSDEESRRATGIAKATAPARNVANSTPIQPGSTAVVRRVSFDDYDPIGNPFQSNRRAGAHPVARVGKVVGSSRTINAVATSPTSAAKAPATRRKPFTFAGQQRDVPAPAPSIANSTGREAPAPLRTEPAKPLRGPLPLTAPQANPEPTVAPPVPPRARRATAELPRVARRLQTQSQSNDLQPRRPDDNAVKPKSDCDRIYNNRDCCEDAENCKKARNKLAGFPIGSINLDISPSIRPSADTPEEAEKFRQQTLQRVQTRRWTDRQGEHLGEGRLVDLRYESIWIEDASGEINKLPIHRLSDDDQCYVAAWWSIPTECRLGDRPGPARNPRAITMTWKASATCNKPLYFEEIQLERYGHTHGPWLQPFVSGAHFVLNIASLPYQMGINPPQECRYPLGYYRPGECAPWLVHPIPFSLRGGLLQAGVVTGAVSIFP